MLQYIRKRLYIVIGSLSLLTLTSCDKNFEAINTNPNYSDSATMNFATLFTSAQLSTSGNNPISETASEYGYDDWRINLIYAGTMIQHIAGLDYYLAGDKYIYVSFYNSAYWDVQYPRAIKYLMAVHSHLKNNSPNSNFYQITRIFRAYAFQRMTDIYGDIPYSEAGAGYTAQISQPKYDKQEDIYADLLKELNEAALALDPSGTNEVGAADLMFGGDVSKWKKFAYSEMLRLAMRMSKVDPANAAKWAKTAYEGGVITSVDDDAVINHPNVYNLPGNGNGSVLTYLDPNAFRVSKTFVDMLKAKQDPRLSYIATVSENPATPWGNAAYDMGDTTWANQLGMPNGKDRTGIANGAFLINNAPGYPGNLNKYSIVNRYTFARMDAPTFVITASENNLLLAEAALKGWISASPEALYNAGIEAGMNQFQHFNVNISPLTNSLSNYLSINKYNAANALAQIHEQYWITTFMDECESWENWRRTGLPVLTAVYYPVNNTNATIPRRLCYPTSETTTNNVHYLEAVSRLKDGDRMTSRTWWDIE